MSDERKAPEGFFCDTLISSEKRITPSVTQSKVCLNRNESPFEINHEIKSAIADRVKSAHWKNYPDPYYPDIERLIASYVGVRADQVVPAAGSANIITVLLNYAAIQTRQIVIASPSFSLYEFHCRSYGIKYDVWKLNENLEYDEKLLPPLKPNALVILASPNNPVGNTISIDKMESLLQNNPTSHFLVDEVYAEFSDINLLPLIDKYQNIMLLRSFSKSMSAAGLRIGFLIAQARFVNEVRKLILPFSLNCFSVEFLRYVLTNKQVLDQQKLNVQWVRKEKLRIESEITSIDQAGKYFKVHPTKTNFIMFFFHDKFILEQFKSHLEMADIKLLDLSSTNLLKNSIRMTIGTEKENNAVIKILRQLVIRDNPGIYF